jgi:hypothetical protein
LSKLAELPDPEVTQLLIRALSHADETVRKCAAVLLVTRRSHLALPGLLARYREEARPDLRAAMAGAIVASGPSAVSDLDPAEPATPQTRLWRCTLAARRRDAAAAAEIVTIATDPKADWQLRRAAIFAAAWLPIEAALEPMIPAIMRERSPLTQDQTTELECHQLMFGIVPIDLKGGFEQIFRRGRGKFIEFFEEVFELCRPESLFNESRPTAAELAGWLFDRLQQDGFPADQAALSRLSNELHVPLLQAALVRSLRICGRPQDIEALLSSSPSAWFTVKCLMERRRAGARDADFASRLRALVTASPYGAVPCVAAVLDELTKAGAAATDQPPPIVLQPPAAVSRASPAPVRRLTYDEAVSVLTNRSVSLDPNQTIVLEPLSQEQFERLAKLADPAKDYFPSVEKYVAGVTFTRGSHLVARRIVTSTCAETQAAIIRPAIAAANRFRVPLEWHETSLTSLFPTGYVDRLLASLVAEGDSDRFYTELDANSDQLLPRLCRAAVATPAAKYADARIVPIILRHVSLGSDEVFETLCTLALELNGTEVDPVLAALLYRFVQSFDLKSPLQQHTMNQGLWRGFNQLTRHPRFELIAGWQTRLAMLLQVQLSWYRRDTIIEVLGRSPRCYLLIEAELLKIKNWRHFNCDPIDQLDAMAERLFPELLES